MRKALQILVTLAEITVTFLKLLPYFLWVYLNFNYLNLKIKRNRKKMAKALKKENIPEHIAYKIAEHIFPEMSFRLWQISSFGSGKMVERFGKRNR
ncbi:MAG: hypothetical protein FGF52_03035 [Candidatus Brockarchaeota archaeon]|nr:hypothetical protein [Candidatus Brockarchaeota archaeon]